MAFDGITVAALTKEFRDALLDGRINKIAQPEQDELLLTIKSPTGTKRLLLCASASLPLAYLTENNKPSPMTAPNFCMLLRKHINNGRIVDITQPKLERIIHFHIEHLDELGDLCRKVLIIELMGKHSNIIFCDDNGRIIDSIKHVSAQMSSVREVLPGRDYFIPDTMNKEDPLTVTEEAFTSIMRAKAMPITKALYTSFTGVSPVVAEEVCYLTGIESRMTPEDLSDDLLVHLYRQFHYLFEDVSEGSFEPFTYYEHGVPREYSCIPLRHFLTSDFRTADSVSSLISSYYAEKETITRIRQKGADLRRIVQTALERNRKKFDLQNRQLRDTEGRDKFRLYGELINVYGYNMEPEAKVLEALNYYTNESVKIPMDPALTPQENSVRYYNKYSKLKRTFEALSKLILDTEDEIRYLESVSNALDIALSEDDLTQIKEELIESGYIKRKATRKKAKFKSQPLHYISSDGYHMYVGKNNYQNEDLTFHFANGGDWWFHVKNAPGSHVIVKSGNEEMPDRVFEEAGKLAAFYSKKRGDDKVEIDYIEKKHVKKVAGAKPGFVIYHTNYSLITDSDISQLQLAE